MVSPLQLWQHPQPRHLWLALGGLSVVAHVGLLGLSLPYVLELMQPSGDRSAALATPIELVVVAPADDAIAQTSAPASQPDTATGSAETPETATAEGSAAQPLSETDPTSAELPEAERRTPADLTATSDRDSPNNSDAQAPATGESGTADTGSSSSESSEQIDQDQTSPAQDSSAQNPSGGQSEGQNEPDTSGSDSDPSVPPTVLGDQPLESPSHSAGTETEQAAAINIISHRQVPESLQRDLTDTPPAPIYSEAATAVTLRPSEHSCKRIEFPQPSATYRVAIRPDGTMAQATPWTGGESRDLSDSERAIACLLESAGFAFEPARIEGEPVLNDNLLLTIEIIESR